MRIKTSILAICALCVLSSSASAAHWSWWWAKNRVLIIDMDGVIVPGDSTYFAAMVKSANAEGHLVSALRLNSPGGNVEEGAALAQDVRSAKVATVVVRGSTCASACFLIFAAGEKKYASAGSRIGVHGVSIDGHETTLTESMTLMMARAVKLLGAPPSVIAKMVTIPPSQIAWLSANEVREMGATLTGVPQPAALPSQASSFHQRQPTGGETPSPANYHIVFTNKNEIVLIDPSRIEEEPLNVRQAWTVTFRAPGHRMKNIAYMQMLGDYDCAGNRFRALSLAMYSADQSYIDGGSGTIDKGWQPSIPETAGDASLRFVCEPPADWRKSRLSFGSLPLSVIAKTLLNRSWPVTDPQTQLSIQVQTGQPKQPPRPPQAQLPIIAQLPIQGR